MFRTAPFKKSRAHLLSGITEITEDDRKWLYSELEDYLKDDSVQSMAGFIQHGNVTTLQHSLRVAEASLALDRALGSRSDRHTLAVSALLHDYYLYDWHGRSLKYCNHGFTHPEAAMQNAVRHFNVSKDIRDAIRTHMWPLTLLHIPKSREAAILCAADKYCSLTETLFCRKRKG